MDANSKRDSNMREPRTNTLVNRKKENTTNFITKVIYYITKKLQINLILKVISPLTEDNQVF